jgi:hypothetical protein
MRKIQIALRISTRLTGLDFRLQIAMQLIQIELKNTVYNIKADDLWSE